MVTCGLSLSQLNHTSKHTISMMIFLLFISALMSTSIAVE
jgi:hypothetical protein